MSTHAPASTKSIVIRDITDLAEMRELESLQRKVWGVEDIDILPALAIKPQVEVGAVLIGAFSDGGMVGFVFGFPGIIDGQTILHSDMLAVRPEFRRHRLGYLLKLAQRESALQKGIRCITWTYDPLQLRNASLNFVRLGVTSKRYVVDFYGKTTSFLHSFGTDRLWVEWKLDSERVEKRVANPMLTSHERPDVPLLVRVGDNDEPVSGSFEGGDALLIEIPGDINELVSRNDGTAQRWRSATQTAFMTALSNGYTVDEFFVTDQESKRAGAYLLRRSNT